MKTKKPLSNSKKGGASSHLRPCKIAYCDKHNERLDETPSNKNIRPKISGNNSVWKHPDVPNLVTLDRQIRKDYFVTHGRHMPERGPSKASPLKESVTLMPNGDKATDEIQKKIVERVEQRFHIRCIRIYNHRDEFCDETGEFNWHGHEVWDMYDHENHCMIKLSRADCREWQDIVAKETGMPRGNPAYETRRKWLEANEYKIQKQNESIQKLDERLHEKEQMLDRMAKSRLAGFFAAIKTKLSGNYSADQVSEMLSKAEEEANQNLQLAQEEAENNLNAAKQEAEEQISDLNKKLSSVRKSLSRERKNKDEEIRKAVDEEISNAEEKAYRRAKAELREQMREQTQEYTRSTKELNDQLAKAKEDLRTADNRINTLQSSYSETNVIAESFLAILMDEKIKGDKKNDFLASFCDHLDKDGKETISSVLSRNKVFRTLRTTAELERYRQEARKSNSTNKNNGVKL